MFLSQIATIDPQYVVTDPYLAALIGVSVAVFLMTVRRLKLGGAVMVVGALILALQAVARFMVLGLESLQEPSPLASAFNDVARAGGWVFAIGFGIMILSWILTSGSIAGALFNLLNGIGVPFRMMPNLAVRADLVQKERDDRVAANFAHTIPGGMKDTMLGTPKH